MKASKDQVVGYVDANGKVKKARVLEAHSDDLARLDHSAGNKDEPAGSHTALAHFNEDKKTPNTFHFISDGNGAAPKREAASS